MYNNNSMDKQKILNPLTGRMISANGATAKSIKGKQKKVSVLEAVIKRKLTKKPEPPKPAPKKFGFEDLDEGVKDMISRYVKKNKSPPPLKFYKKAELKKLKKDKLRMLFIEGSTKKYNEDVEVGHPDINKYTKEELIENIIEEELYYDEKWFNDAIYKKVGSIFDAGEDGERHEPNENYMIINGFKYNRKK